jgi:CheY-like chemotaxis protein
MSDSTGAAVAIQMEIPKSMLVRVLVIDDEASFQEDMKEYFEAYEYTVDVADSISKAKELLREHNYQIILTDVNFPGLAQEGDRFVLQNFKSFKGARVIVVTGLDINSVRNRNALEGLGVPIWDKGDPNWGSKLTSLAWEVAAASKKSIEAEVNDFIADRLGEQEGGYIVQTGTVTNGRVEAKPWEIAMEDILIDWLKRQSDQEEPFLSIGREVLSANKMIYEIKEKSAIGEELLQMFVNEMRRCVGTGET